MQLGQVLERSARPMSSRLIWESRRQLLFIEWTLGERTQ